MNGYMNDYGNFIAVDINALYPGVFTPLLLPCVTL